MNLTATSLEKAPYKARVIFGGPASAVVRPYGRCGIPGLSTTFGIPGRSIDASAGHKSWLCCTGHEPGAGPDSRVDDLNVPDLKGAGGGVDPRRAADFGPQLLHDETNRFQGGGFDGLLGPAHVAADNLKPFGRSALLQTDPGHGGTFLLEGLARHPGGHIRLRLG